MTEEKKLDEILIRQKNLEEIVASMNKDSKISGEDQLFFGVIISLLLLFVTLSANDTALFFQSVFNASKETALTNAYNIKYFGIIVFLTSSITRYCSAIIAKQETSKKFRYFSFEALWLGLSLIILTVAVNFFALLTPQIGLSGISVTFLILTIALSVMLFLERKILSFYIRNEFILKKDFLPYSSIFALTSVAGVCLAVTEEILAILFGFGPISVIRLLITYAIVVLILFKTIMIANKRRSLNQSDETSKKSVKSNRSISKESETIQSSYFKSSYFSRMMKVSISENLYLLLIALVFFSISVFLGLEIWAFQDKFIEYGLAISLFTSSIFLVLTIVFLSWLLNAREKKEWNVVKKDVHSRLRFEIEIFSSFLIMYAKNNEDIPGFGSVPTENRGSYFHDVLYGLTKVSKAEINEGLATSFFSKDHLKDLRQHANNFGTIESRYIKFLSPKEVQSLMHVQTSILHVEIGIQLYLSEIELDKTGQAHGVKPPEGFVVPLCEHLRTSSKPFKKLLLDLQKLGKLIDDLDK